MARRDTETRDFLRSIRSASEGREHVGSGPRLDDPFYGILLVSGEYVVSANGGEVGNGSDCSIIFATYPIDPADCAAARDELPEKLFLAFLQRTFRGDDVLYLTYALDPEGRDVAERRRLIKSPRRSPEGVAKPDRDANHPASFVDFFWSRFFACGDPGWLHTIISFLKITPQNQRRLADGRINAAPLEIAWAAEWSLIANAKRHRRVLEVCRSELFTSGKPVRRFLGPIVNSVGSVPPVRGQRRWWQFWQS